MVTNLLFKRVVNVEGHHTTEMKIVKVSISELKSSEGWQLVSSADKVTFHDNTPSVEDSKKRIEEALKINNNQKITNPSNEATLQDYTKPEVDALIENALISNSKYDKIKEIPSNCPGTACLVRVKDTIRITYRRGKKANDSTPNRVCINDYDKQHFFNAVKKNRGTNTDIWCLEITDPEYEHWNSAMDKYYQEQRSNYIKYLISQESRKK